MNPPNSKHQVSDKELVLLGLLAEAPNHAYGLEDKIRTRHMTEWTEIGFSSIYRVLAALEEQGLIDSRLEHGGQGATRKVLALNPRGVEALAVGVAQQLESLKPVKNPFAVGLAFLTAAPHAEVVASLRRRAAQLEGFIQSLAEGFCDNPKTPTPTLPPRHELCRGLLFNFIRRHLFAEREFIAAALQELQSADPSLFAPPESIPVAAAPAPAADEVSR